MGTQGARSKERGARGKGQGARAKEEGAKSREKTCRGAVERKEQACVTCYIYSPGGVEPSMCWYVLKLRWWEHSALAGRRKTSRTLQVGLTRTPLEP